MDAVFIDYRPKEGAWVFKVSSLDHISSKERQMRNFYKAPNNYLDHSPLDFTFDIVTGLLSLMPFFVSMLKGNKGRFSNSILAIVTGRKHWFCHCIQKWMKF